jgi:serine kinase of HPr protein (carbohydrate metabolism regulator)
VTQIHATAVAIGGRAVLLLAPPGGGKSDLALRLIDRGAVLVSDDQVELSLSEGRLIAAAPATIAGRLEARGVGIVEMTHISPMPVSLLIDLADLPERMPEPRVRALLGVEVPVVALAPFQASAPMKVEWALHTFGLGS